MVEKLTIIWYFLAGVSIACEIVVKNYRFAFVLLAWMVASYLQGRNSMR